MSNVHSFRDLMSKVSSFSDPVQYLPIWKLHHIIVAHGDVATFVPVKTKSILLGDILNFHQYSVCGRSVCSDEYSVISVIHSFSPSTHWDLSRSPFFWEKNCTGFNSRDDIMRCFTNMLLMSRWGTCPQFKILEASNFKLPKRSVCFWRIRLSSRFLVCGLALWKSSKPSGLKISERSFLTR